MTIQAIPTTYKGVEYRSRTEARWAVFFDALGVEHLYEYEGYQLESGWYLCDFYLPRQQVWIEVKGQAATPQQVQRCLDLANATQKPVCIFDAPIGHWNNRDIWTRRSAELVPWDKGEFWFIPPESETGPDGKYSHCAAFTAWSMYLPAVCEKCGVFEICASGYIQGHATGCKLTKDNNGGHTSSAFSQPILKACDKANKYRFRIPQDAEQRRLKAEQAKRDEEASRKWKEEYEKFKASVKRVKIGYP